MLRTRFWRPGLAGVCGAGALLAGADAWGQSPAELSQLSLEELTEVQVTSVSKHPEPLSQAPSAIYVISHDDIVRSGARTVPDMLRLAPNLQVAQTSSTHFVVTARGFSGNSQGQSFSNKLLVLIDGRSVYTPLYSGVYWDMQDVLPENVDRIEVISGPGATLWGANAVNGVINIITRKAEDTQGALVEAGVGSGERRLDAQVGGAAGPNVAWRIYGRAQRFAHADTLAGDSAGDAAKRVQGGFRVDWAASEADAVTVQGDVLDGSEGQLGAGDEHIDGRNLLARWTHTGVASDLQVQAYYDREGRATEGGGGKFHVHTFDVSVEDHRTIGERHDVVVGLDVRRSGYDIYGTGSLFFAPPSGSLNLLSLFAQDTIALDPRLHLILGLKVEDDPYVDPTLLPNARLSWTPTDRLMLWAAVSKAVRSPTPFDVDVRERLGDIDYVSGDKAFRHEQVTAYEAGARIEPAARLSLSVSAYYNRYDELRSIEFTNSGLPLRWDNLMRGGAYGLEAWGDYQVRRWWRLSAGFNTMSKDLSFAPGASGLLGTQIAGDDPKYQATLRSQMDLGPAVSFQSNLRYVSALPDPRVPAYLQADARLAWNATPHIQLAVDGRNLLYDRREEFPGGVAIPRSVFFDVQWRF